jgi:hypothetical protein
MVAPRRQRRAFSTYRPQSSILAFRFCRPPVTARDLYDTSPLIRRDQRRSKAVDFLINRDRTGDHP